MEVSFNNIHNWAYHRIPEVLGAGIGFDIVTEGQLDAALDQAIEHTDTSSILSVQIDPNDCSAALERMARRIGSLVAAGGGDT